MSILSEVSVFLESIPTWVSSAIIALTGSFVGALTGGFFTLRGVDREAKINRAESEKESLELQLSVLKGVKGEVATLMDLYDKRMRKLVDNIKPDNFLDVIFPIGDDNFTFYEKNANVVAKLSDSSRDSIIKIYTYARSLIQSYKGNNQLITDCEKIIFDMADNNKNRIMYEKLHSEKIQIMIDYAQGLQSIDAELKEVKELGFNVINQEIAELQAKIQKLTH
ncbi:hypothetical protein [Erwinia sp. SLM-02]|uniref:hypothetical protein n=1 Tax=Erwinia sp. SLM-02 TaxID=3020057 RepID=UPI00308006BF